MAKVDMATRKPGYTDAGRIEFAQWGEDIATMFQKQTQYFLGYAVKAAYGYYGFAVTLSGEGDNDPAVRPVDALRVAVEDLAQAEAAKVTGGVFINVRVVNERQVHFTYDVPGF